MVYILTEKLFDQVDETGKTKIDDSEFSKLLNTVRKLVAAIQMFSVSSTLFFQFLRVLCNFFFTDFLIFLIFILILLPGSGIGKEECVVRCVQLLRMVLSI